MKPTSVPSPIRLTGWAVVTPTPDPYTAPELCKPMLSGDAYGHPRFDNGKNITTSQVIGKNASDHILTKSGSVYQIGLPKPEYAEMFPDVRRRLLDSLPLIK